LGEGDSNKGDYLSRRGGNKSKIHCTFKKKIFFFRTSKPKLIKFGTYYPWVKGIQVSSIKVPGPLQRGDNCKNGVGSFKNLILRNYEARKVEFYMETISHKIDLLIKIMAYSFHYEKTYIIIIIIIIMPIHYRNL
jgi:hypothetical protein